MRTTSLRRTSVTALAFGTVAALAACSPSASPGSAPAPSISASSSSPAPGPGARVAVAYEGGIRVLDGATLRPSPTSAPRSSRG